MDSTRERSISMGPVSQLKKIVKMTGDTSATSVPMKRARQTRKKANRLPPFVALTWKLLNSKAYKELPPSAAKALPFFLGKPKLPYGDPAHLTTQFSFSYGEGKRYGFAPSTFSKIIQALMRTGFIDPVYKGGLRGGGLSSSVFTLSGRWEQYGQPDFHKVEWKQFRTDKRTKPTSVLAINRFNMGKKTADGEGNLSQSEVVGAL